MRKQTVLSMLLGVVAASVVSGCASQNNDVPEPAVRVIPTPVKIEYHNGGAVFPGNVPVVEEIADLQLSPEGYRLEITPDGITITGQSQAGVFYGRQTLMQMIAIESCGSDTSEVSLPACTITDYPRVGFRSLMLDVSRHFLPLEDVKRQVDWMAEYKFNRLQLHLTDDQGWRIEIKKYPKLTEIGSKRGSAENPYGPYFYTQEELRDLIDYAAERNITVTPEIDIPGHCLAALASYPELGCTGGPYEVWNDIGISEDILCGGNPATLEFLTGVFTEVAELFPGPYIHIGGDECPVVRWDNCPRCKEAMQRLGTANPRVLQADLTAKVVDVIRKKGKRAICWDELLESGIPEDMIIMSWRGNGGALRGMKQGHDAIVASYTHLYFDYAQGKTSQERNSAGSLITLRRVYSFEPTLGNSELTQKHLIGAQANHWSESIYDRKWLEHKSMPRMFALSEALWSPEENRDFSDFQNRLMYHFRRLDALNIDARYAAWELPEVICFDKEYTVDCGELPTGVEILYTTDGSNPAENPEAKRYSLDRPHFTANGILTMCLVLPSGRKSFWNRAELIKMEPDVERLAAGLRFEIRQQPQETIEAMKSQPATAVLVTDSFDFQKKEFPDSGFGFVADGFFHAKKSGNYEFSSAVQGSNQLYLDGRLLIANSSWAPYFSKDSSVYLTEGYHPIRVEFAAGAHGQLQLYYAFNQERQMPLSGDVLVHEQP